MVAAGDLLPVDGRLEDQRVVVPVVDLAHVAEVLEDARSTPRRIAAVMCRPLVGLEGDRAGEGHVIIGQQAVEGVGVAGLDGVRELTHDIS